MTDILEPYGYPEIPANKTRRFTYKCLTPCHHKWTEDVEYKFFSWELDSAGYHKPTWIHVNQTPPRCPKCLSVFVKGQSIKGTYSASHKCDSRCTNATGRHCECQCGGNNHGSGHLITRA